jgi:uncharacterized coiled-coil protein SlyX
MTAIKSWVSQNLTFVIAQGLVLIAAIGGLIVYYVNMEARVTALETRGAAYTVNRLGKIDERLTVLEQIAVKNAASIERIVDKLTK